MPELPEVESVRRGLESYLIDEVIEKVEVRWERIVIADDLPQWQRKLQSRRFIGISRRGKHLLLHLSGGATLISHLRMEGKYIFYHSLQELDQAKDQRHLHVLFYLKSGHILAYHDVRKFGRMELVPTDEVNAYFQHRQLGPEPTETEFDLEVMQRALKRTKRAIKTALLDQKIVAGLGNIYVDEVLFRAQVHPETPANLITPAQAQVIRQQTIQVLTDATQKGGSSIRSYLNALGEKGTYQDELLVYGQTGAPCPNCQTPIEKIKVNQRGTHYCPHCQVWEEK